MRNTLPNYFEEFPKGFPLELKSLFRFALFENSPTRLIEEFIKPGTPASIKSILKASAPASAPYLFSDKKER